MAKSTWIMPVVVLGGLAGAAPGAITFTFFDPAAGPEITHTEGTDNATDPGIITWTGSGVTFTVDGSEDGLGSQVFSATIAMTLEIGAVTDMVGGTFIAPILFGTFSFSDTGSGETILSAIIGSSAGAVLTLGTTGSIISQGGGEADGLNLTAGTALSSLLGGLTFAPNFDANFTLTSISPPIMLNGDGFLSDFTANSAFTGNAQLVPSPGASAIIGMSMMLAVTRRRRTSEDRQAPACLG